MAAPGLFPYPAEAAFPIEGGVKAMGLLDTVRLLRGP